MIIEIGLLFATYVGTKAFEYSKSKKGRLEKRKVEREKKSGKKETSQKLLEIAEEQRNSLVTGENIESKEDTERQNLLYLKTSMVSMGLFAFKGLIPGAVPLGLATYLYSAIPYMKNVEKSLRKDKKVNVDVLFFAADVLTLGVQNYFTAAFGLHLIHSGKYMVGKAKDDSAKMVTHLFKELPQVVWKVVDGVEIEIPLENVKADDLLVIGSGGVIPVDGVIQEGLAQIDQQSLTGEAQPAEKEKGDSVFANTIVMTGKLFIRVSQSGKDTTSARIAEMLFHSVSFKSGVQLKGERWADKMTLPMLISSMAVLPIIGPASTAVFINGHMGARIQLFAPMMTLKHISEASKLGILVKDGRSLESLSDVNTVLFDKTGTLTTNQPEVTKVIARNKHTEKEILAYASTAEQKLGHPIAKAILKKAKEEKVVLHEVQDSSYKLGYGISVSIGGKLIRVGSVRFFQEEGIKIPNDVLLEQEKSHLLGNTFILVGIDQTIGGILELQPQIRPEVQEMIAQLREIGIDHIGIVSGDHQAPTQKLAEDLEVDEYFYDVLPENKAQVVEKLQAEGRIVCFIGDGINDSIALKKANVSMSIAGATSIAEDMAEIIFMDGSLSHLVEIIKLSKRLEIGLKRSLILCLVPGLANFAGAFFLNFSILTSLLINSGVGLLGTCNLMLPSRKKIPPKIENESSKKILPVDSTSTILQPSFEKNKHIKLKKTVGLNEGDVVIEVNAEEIVPVDVKEVA